MPKDIPQHRPHNPAQHKHAAKPRERRAKAQDRGYDNAWHKFRTAFLIRNPLCEYCLARGITKAAVVCDHDLPHDHDPDLFWNNTFTALCANHHNSTKQRLEARYKGDDLLRMIAVMKGKPTGSTGSPHTGMLTKGYPHA